MSRKVYVEVKVRLIVRMDDDENAPEVGDVISEMDYGFTSQTEGADIEETEITDYLVTDSK
jgi:hypothetical protein